MSNKPDKDYSQGMLPDEPLLDTYFLDRWAELDLPMRGKHRERVLDRIRQQAKQRRTIQGVSQRMSNQMISPVTNAVNAEMQQMTQNVVESQLNSVFGVDQDVSESDRNEL